MGLIASIWMCVLGLLGASNLIIARQPEAKELISKLSPYQGWIGAVSALWGVWCIILAVLNIGWLTSAPIMWITSLAVAICLFALGLLLGVGVLKTFISQETAVQKMDLLITQLSPYQGTLGLVGIGLGVWSLVVVFVF